MIFNDKKSREKNNLPSYFPKIYVLSTGRAGSTFLCKMLNLNVHFPIVSHQDCYSKMINILGNMLITGVIPESMLDNVTPTSQIINLSKSTTDPLRSCIIALYLKHHRPNWEYRIIHLIRDPRDFVTSFINWKNRKLSGMIAHHAVPFWQPNPFLTREVPFNTWLSMSKFEYFSWLWKFKNKFFLDLFEMEENYYVVRLEDLISVKDGIDNFNRLLRFIKMPEMDKKLKSFLVNQINKSNEDSFPRWKYWNRAKAIILDNYCGDLMKKFNYGIENNWLRLLNRN